MTGRCDMEMMEFEALKEEVLSELKEKKICSPAYKGVMQAENFAAAFNTLKRYWSSMIFEHKAWVTEFVEKYYKSYKTEFNRVNFFYDESSDRGLVFLSDSPMVEVSGDAEVYALGNSQYKASGHVRVSAYDTSKGHIEGYAKAVLNDSASCTASGFSVITANGNNEVTADGSVTVYAGGNSRVRALRWKRISASGNSVISAPVRRNIELTGNSTFEKTIADGK